MDANLSPDDILFDVQTPLGFRVRVTIGYWRLISTVKHPAIRDREGDIQETLRNPDEVRVSRADARVYLFYRADGAKRWLCAVSRQVDGYGFLVTAYRTSSVKEGTRIWPK